MTIKVETTLLFEKLVQKIRNKFAELQSSTQGFDLYWIDADKDFLRIPDNESLLDAHNDMTKEKRNEYKLYALMKRSDTNSTENNGAKPKSGNSFMKIWIMT